jgi:hypothetical protein
MLNKYLGGLVKAIRSKPAANLAATPGNGVFSKEFAAQLNQQSKWPTPGIVASGQIAYTSPGTYSFVAPAGVTSVSVVAVGSSGTQNNTNWSSGGAGGGLGWSNNISITPGQSYTVVVGNVGTATGAYNSLTVTHAGDSYFISTSTVRGGGGKNAAYPFNSGGEAPLGGTYTGAGGGNGGNGGIYNSSYAGYQGGGGGAGGYTGPGGRGATNDSNRDYYLNAESGSGGGGGGGGTTSGSGRGGGGVGILGQGSSGSGGNSNPTPGIGGSGGANGDAAYSSFGGTYGGGGSGGASQGTSGAVRIIWGTNRAFPSTNTGNI